MSYKNGINALHLEMPDKIPRTEYSAHFYWDLIQKVTGIQVNSKSSTETQKKSFERIHKSLGLRPCLECTSFQ